MQLRTKKILFSLVCTALLGITSGNLIKNNLKTSKGGESTLPGPKSIEDEDPNKLFMTFEMQDEMMNRMKISVNTIWILTSSVYIISMQLGFTLLEVGSIHPKNKSNILIKNLLDTFIGAIAYYSIGYSMANLAQGGIIGNAPLFCMGLDSKGLLRWLF